VFQGQHGYVSPSWYVPGVSQAPTWNFSAVHCHGTPQILAPDDNLAVLTRLTAHFEQHVDDPMWLDQEYGARVARGTVGLRIPIDRFTAKIKMSQDKDPASVQNVIDRLREPGPYRQPHLAADMERARDEGIGYATTE
jgi:transcriptional regulator